MIVLRDTASMQAALQSPLDPALRDLIARRIQHFLEHVEGDLSELVNFVIVELGDHMEAVEKALGFSPLENLVDGSRFGDPEFTPSFEWVQDHGGFFELVYILSDSGFGIIALVPDHPGIHFDLHMLCLEHARPLQP